MATASQLFTDRDTAGAAYAAALADFRAAWINLKALDIACDNGNVVKAHPAGGALPQVRSFEAVSKWGIEALRHPQFASAPGLAEWERTAQANAATLINGLGS
ncbi:MAG TPA: hypothetical protein VNV16_09800 [Methylibium sp.]|nr:hypothetical protein [Methylibium sp.]